MAANSQAASAVAIVNLFENGDMTWAGSESKMNIGNVRLHLRVLRRASFAVLDQSQPKYEDSALYWLDRNEELWGRKGHQVAMQETSKSIDMFTSCIPDLSDLRLVCETLHVMFLRGYNIKPMGRQTAEVAKAILLMCKIPKALFLYKKGFATLYSFYITSL